MDVTDKMASSGNPPPYSADSAQPPAQPAPQMIGVVIAPPAVVPIMVGQQMGSQPSPFTCKSCRAQIVTRVEMKNTLKTHLFALLLCVFGCWPCVFIPYCTKTCKNADHYCPNCGSYIGSSVN